LGLGTRHGKLYSPWYRLFQNWQSSLQNLGCMQTMPPFLYKVSPPLLLIVGCILSIVFPNVMACNVLGWTSHIIGYGMAFDTTHNAHIAPWREWYIEYGTCGDMCPKPTPFPAHMGWGKLGKWCHHMWRLEALAKKAHLGHVWVGLTCTPTLIVDGWANLCYCSHCPI
jgi:hypothetical protein